MLFTTRDFFFFCSDPLFPLELDEENLTSNAKQKWKPSASKQQCREAYEFVDTFVIIGVKKVNIFLRFLFFFFAPRRAISEMIQSDDGETSVDNGHQ